MSQNLLSTSEGFLTWGWNRSEGSVFKGTWRYYGLGLNLTLSGTYGGHQNIYPVYSYNVDRHELEFPLPPKIGKYYSVDVGLALPLLFDRGSHTRQLTLATGWNYSNGLVANVGRLNVEHGKVTNMAVIGYSDGIHKLTSSIAFSDMKRRAPRDFVSPWGVVLSVNHAINPDNGHFGNLIVGYAKLYTPGFARHHSLTLAASYQTSLGGFSSEYVLSGSCRTASLRRRSRTATTRRCRSTTSSRCATPTAGGRATSISSAYGSTSASTMRVSRSRRGPRHRRSRCCTTGMRYTLSAATYRWI